MQQGTYHWNKNTVYRVFKLMTFLLLPAHEWAARFLIIAALSEDKMGSFSTEVLATRERLNFGAA